MEELLDYLRSSLHAFQECPADSEFLRGYECAHRSWLEMVERAGCANVLIEGKFTEIRKAHNAAFSSGFESGVEDVYEYLPP